MPNIVADKGFDEDCCQTAMGGKSKFHGEHYM